MPDAMIRVSGFLAVISAVGVAGLFYDRPHGRHIPPCDW